MAWAGGAMSEEWPMIIGFFDSNSQQTWHFLHCFWPFELQSSLTYRTRSPSSSTDVVSCFVFLSCVVSQFHTQLSEYTKKKNPTDSRDFCLSIWRKSNNLRSIIDNKLVQTRSTQKRTNDRVVCAIRKKKLSIRTKKKKSWTCCVCVAGKANKRLDHKLNEVFNIMSGWELSTFPCRRIDEKSPSSWVNIGQWYAFEFPWTLSCAALVHCSSTTTHAIKWSSSDPMQISQDMRAVCCFLSLQEKKK